MCQKPVFSRLWNAPRDQTRHMFSPGFYYRASSENSAVLTLGHELVMRRYGVYSVLLVCISIQVINGVLVFLLCSEKADRNISLMNLCYFLAVSANFSFFVLSLKWSLDVFSFHFPHITDISVSNLKVQYVRIVRPMKSYSKPVGGSTSPE